MDSSSLNQYEERLYSVFKSFDVDNEEALNKSAVLALCDALQLEQRGAALVDTLFERRDQRVTFAQFRSGLLAVLGDGGAPPASDDDSSGREVAPKFVFGSKKYGRRSRPPRPSSAPSAAGAPAPAPAPALELEHDSPVTCEGALQLCRRLRMDGVDRRLIERIFESAAGAEVTVGEFFERLNASLTSTIHDAVAGESGVGPTAAGDQEEEALSAELVVETWERAGVQRPRRLLAELGFESAAVPASALHRVLVDELRALAEPADARTLLPLAALAVAGLRLERARAAADTAAAERDRLRADLDEANRRARILAQEVDENHARLEADLTANLRKTEARHAEALRRLEADRGAERDRAAAERAGLEAEIARRTELEQRLRVEADALRERIQELETRANSADERRAAAEKESARLAEEVRAAEARAGGARGAALERAAALAARVDELRADNARLRDRADELCAQLEARPAAAPPPPASASWHDEAGAVAPALLPLPQSASESESPPVSLEAPPAEDVAALRARLADAEAQHCAEKQRLDDLVKELESSLEQMRVEYERCEEYWSGKLEEERALLAGEARAGDERLAELLVRVADYERQFAARLPPVSEQPALEAAAAELDAEAERARAVRAELQRMAERLQRRDAELQRRDAELQRRDAELQRRDAELARRQDELQRRERDTARRAAGLEAFRRVPRGAVGAGAGMPAAGVGAGAGAGAAAAVEAELRGRLLRAEAAVARLAARLAAADVLVKDLYVENCLRGPAPRRL